MISGRKFDVDFAHGFAGGVFLECPYVVMRVGADFSAGEIGEVGHLPGEEGHWAFLREFAEIVKHFESGIIVVPRSNILQLVPTQHFIV